MSRTDLSDSVPPTRVMLEPMTLEEVKSKCPVAFLEGPSNPKLSHHYEFVPTYKVVEDLMKLGWHPVKAQQRKPRKGIKARYTKHMITFQNPNIVIKGDDGDDVYPHIILVNSHDGMSSFKFFMGLYRLVCSNGLVVADKRLAEFKIRHMGYSFEELETLVIRTVNELPDHVEVLNKFYETELTQEQQESYALNALLIRAGITLGSEESSSFKPEEGLIESLLSPSRKADEGDTAWVVYNRVQERIINGGFMSSLAGAKVRKVRKITSFEKDLDINKKLYQSMLDLVEA